MSFVPTVFLLAASAWAEHEYALHREYRFEIDTERYVSIWKCDEVVFGTLDRFGDFHQSSHIEVPKRDDGFPRTLRYSGPKHDCLTNWAVKSAKLVYEFRSDMLIPGHFEDDFNFVPSEGGKIIKFVDYKYTPDAPPIWNLPGKFVPKEDVPKK